MTEILHTFGIDWRLLLISAINFGLLLAGLTYFLYKPVLAMLEERRATVAQGVEDARQAAQALEQIEAARAERLARAGAEADQLLAAARAAGEERRRAALEEGQRRAQALVAAGEREAGELKEQALRESKEELAALVILGIDKLQRNA